jgi:hypothetical protein
MTTGAVELAHLLFCVRHSTFVAVPERSITVSDHAKGALQFVYGAAQQQLCRCILSRGVAFSVPLPLAPFLVMLPSAAYFETVTPHRDIGAVVTACASDAAATDESTIKVQHERCSFASPCCLPLNTPPQPNFGLWHFVFPGLGGQAIAVKTGELLAKLRSLEQPISRAFLEVSRHPLALGVMSPDGHVPRCSNGIGHVWCCVCSCLVVCMQDPGLRLAPAMQRFIYGVATADPTLSAV